MLSAIIEQLTSLGSKQFALSAFVPVLVFGFLNGVVLYFESATFRAWAGRLMTLEASFEGFTILIALGVVAYALWGLSAFMAEILGGNRLPPHWPFDMLYTSQLERYGDRQKKYYHARDERARIADRKKAWVKKLSDDGVVGTTSTTTNTYDPKGSEAAKELEKLRKLRIEGADTGTENLTTAIEAFGQELRTNNLQQRQANGGNPLADDHRDLLTLVDHAMDRWGTKELALAAELQVRFARREVAPTAFGNVVAALRSYGYTRYGLSLPTVWTRLQSLIATEASYFASLQSVKAQVDFSVISCWLAVASTAVWAIVLPFWGSSPWRFLAVAILGPLIARFAYLAAVENYVAFGEVVRAGVDLYRFRLLEALSLPRPRSLSEERRIWEALRKVTDFGQESIDIGYIPPKEGKT
jgi:hypothetical protein